MAERSQYQYQPVTGPVWREPVADRLAWLPSGRHQPAAALPPNRLGDFAQPVFDALYKPQGLQWLASDRYAGRLLPRALLDWSVYPPQNLAPLYDPQTLEWQPRGTAPRVPVERRLLGDYEQPAFDALYKPQGLQWLASDRSAGRLLPRALLDWSSYPPQNLAPLYDPQTLEWQPRATAPRVPVERRLLGDYQQPAFDALYKPQGLQWLASDRYAGHLLPRALLDWSIYPPQNFSVAFDASGMQWLPMGAAPRMQIERRIVGDFTQPDFNALYKAAGLQWLPSDRYAGRALQRVLADWSIYPPQDYASYTYTANSPTRIGASALRDSIERIGPSSLRPGTRRIG